MNIVLIEDNDSLRELIRQILVDEGYQVFVFSKADEFSTLDVTKKIDLFLIDIGLPGENGLSIAKRLRAAYPLVGIIMVTARTALQDRVQSYDSGADLFLPKPFDAKELVSIVRSFEMRMKRSDNALHGQDYVLHTESFTLRTPEGNSVALTDSDVHILQLLGRAKDQQLEHWQLAEQLGLDIDNEKTKANLEVRITRLRKKIATDASQSIIHPIRGVGYKLCIPLKVIH